MALGEFGVELVPRLTDAERVIVDSHSQEAPDFPTALRLLGSFVSYTGLSGEDHRSGSLEGLDEGDLAYCGEMALLGYLKFHMRGEKGDNDATEQDGKWHKYFHHPLVQATRIATGQEPNGDESVIYQRVGSEYEFEFSPEQLRQACYETAHALLVAGVYRALEAQEIDISPLSQLDGEDNTPLSDKLQEVFAVVGRALQSEDRAETGWGTTIPYCEYSTTLADLAEKGSAQCVVFTTIGAVALLAAGIDSYVVSCPGHAFNAVSVGLKGEAQGVIYDGASAPSRQGEAIEAYQMEGALPLAPIQVNYANLLLRLGRFDEAEAHYKEALRIDPGYPAPHNNYGELLVLRGRWAEAIISFVKIGNVVNLNELVWFVIKEIPKINHRIGQYNESRPDLEDLPKVEMPSAPQGV